MTNSICIIETRSLALSSQVLQQILRSKKIDLLSLQIPGDGSVISFICGEYSEIKSAMESASAISKSSTSYFGQKIITKPDEKLFDLLQLKRSTPAKTEVIKADKKRISTKKTITIDSTPSKESVFDDFEPIKAGEAEIPSDSIEQNRSVRKSLPKTEVKKEKTDEAVHQPFKGRSDNPTIARLKKEALGIKENDNDLIKSVTNVNETENEGNGPADLEQLKKFNVHKLRRFARSFNGFPIKGREISRANREELLNYFKELI
ncbi:MAG TPA: BMC domain-containing protein [Ignavibacteriaceae bacterium]|nr:BMC domain-containing protein [Ignavibacteriaceae bacterium]